jgi:hypothetical protein
VNTQESGPDRAPRQEARRPSLARRVADLLVSPKLAIALLLVVLACCVAGVTAVRGARAGELIFSTLWFNALLVLLAVSSFAAFFSRIWRRRWTVVSVGMILFHLSFAAMLGGIVWNRLFYFRGVLRLTEGETLPNGLPDSYDSVEHGRLFDFSRLRGATTLVAMHRDYKVDGGNKRAAYEIAVGETAPRPHHVIYVTEYLDWDGVRYFCSKEGYSVLLIVSDQDGKERYGAHVPLQSFRRDDGTYHYASGTSSEEVAFAFPPEAEGPLLAVFLSYRPSTIKDRQGEVTFRTWPASALSGSAAAAGPQANPHVASGDPFGAHADPLTPEPPARAGAPDPHAGAGPTAGAANPHAAADAAGAGHGAPDGSSMPRPEHEGRVLVGAPFDAGAFLLTPREIRYWVGMDVRYDPGLTVILASLCFGLAGMVVTFVGRIRQGAARKRREGQAEPASAGGSGAPGEAT